MDNISVIVPIYNVNLYLKRCVDSILMQTYENIELILVDDGSTDNCGKICDDYKKKDDRIKIIHQKNAGVSIARNVGLDIATGAYIIFIDADDFIHPRMLEILYSDIEKTGAMIAISNHMLVYPRQKINTRLKGYKAKVMTGLHAVERITNKGDTNMIIACGKLFKRDLFSDIRFPNVRYYEDEYVTFKLLYRSQKVCETKEILYYYYQHAKSIVNSPFTREKLVALNPLKDAVEFFEKQKEKKLADQAMYRYLFSIQIVFYRARYEMKDNQPVLDELLETYRPGVKEHFKRCSGRISPIKKIILKFFYFAPYLYTSLVRICVLVINLFKRNLS